jgi:exopolysaccharide production protein ExoY
MSLSSDRIGREPKAQPASVLRRPDESDARVLMSPPCRHSAIYRGKRVLDVTCALVSLALFLPVLIFISLAIKVSSKGPVLYSQTRLGYGGRPFRCLKFRTMAQDADQRLQEILATCPSAAREYSEYAKLRADPRVTVVGRFLRRWSLDELPQIFNVLIGQMSFVGPRPILPHEVERYSDSLPRYISVKPGITGLWQISGRCQTTFAARVLFDQAYIENHSLRDDLAIIARTATVLLRRTGAY